MILIPQRLFTSPQVETILRDGNVCVLRKELTTPVLDREAYVSNHVVSIVLAGEQRIRPQDGRPIHVRAGEVLFLPRGIYYVTDLLPPDGGPFESLLSYFDDALIERFLSATRVDEVDPHAGRPYLKFDLEPSVRMFAENLLAVYRNRRVRSKAFVDLKILELLHLLNQLAGDRQFAEFLFRLTLPQQRNIRRFMAQNYDKPLKIEDYAYLTGRSPTTFRRDFKAHFGTTPQQWLKEQRLAKAQTVLDREERNVGDLAYEVGYENTSYFIREFKARTGHTPKQYMLRVHRNRLQ